MFFSILTVIQVSVQVEDSAMDVSNDFRFKNGNNLSYATLPLPSPSLKSKSPPGTNNGRKTDIQNAVCLIRSSGIVSNIIFV